ncbi:outer membrane protein assembly factor BamE [Rhodoferax sp.]|uniref:outer membrane protein assembly factor BamE n=1 Tax=Rhodoferax sp. TaxID=50421 RepID=UPI00351D2DF7
MFSTALWPVIRQFRVISSLFFLMIGLSACDVQRIAELEEGVATEGDVRMKFGEPEKIWEGANGARIFEYNRQPEGAKNYMITIGTDGKMSALRQVLTPANFAKIQPGMAMEEVRRMLGKPMKITPFELQKTWHYDWRYIDGPNESDKKIFTVIFNSDLRVVSTASVVDTGPQLR